jgi:FAD/FMN-containing dehydrogenase
VVPPDHLLQELEDLLGPKELTRDPDALAPWLTDWRGRYRGGALGMAMPASTDEVAAIVRACARHRTPIVPQGGNTSMVGGATPATDGAALLVSMRRMHRVRRVDPAAGLAVAEAGVILSDLHVTAAEYGMRFPLSLGAKGSATIGGLCATNAGGTQVLRFGTMRALVMGIEAVLPDGSVLDNLAPLKKDNRGPDLKQLLIGAEGTLGIITAATLQLVPQPEHGVTCWASTPSPQAALALLRRLERAGLAVESFEILPEESLAAVLRHIPGTRAPLATHGPWHTLVEVTGGTGLRDRVEQELAGALSATLIEDAVIAENEAQAEMFWRIRESISEAERADGPALQHDISVPVGAMPDFMTSAASAVEQRFPGTRASGFGHLGDGNVHFHVRAPLGVDGQAWVAGNGEAVSGFVYDLVHAAGGSLSAEHGIGQMKLAAFARSGGPARLNALRALKAAFDPLGIMNPGKLIPPADAPSLASGAAAP